MHTPHTHTHTHPFNGPLSGTTRVSQYQKGKTNDFTGARDSEWQWHQQGRMQVCTSHQTDNHASISLLSFLQARCPSCCPTNSVKALKAKMHTPPKWIFISRSQCYPLDCIWYWHLRAHHWELTHSSFAATMLASLCCRHLQLMHLAFRNQSSSSAYSVLGYHWGGWSSVC